MLKSIEINPQSAVKRSVIWMHGLGADANDFVPIVTELHLPDELGVRFVFPNAPVMPISINNGYEMRAWYDIAAPDLHANVDQSGIQQSTMLVQQLIQQEIDRGLASTDIILAGFSQGAAMALTVGLCYPQTLGGMIALSGYLPLMDKVLQEATEANRKTPIFIGHGTEDFLVPYRLSQLVYSALHSSNYPVSMHSYPMQHSVCLEEVRDISEWLQEAVTCHPERSEGSGG
jgi:phospholipase/carboxylesterase